MGYSQLELTGKVAVVIGGTSGIGLALAQGLASAGADVVPTGRRSGAVQTAVSVIEKIGRRSVAMECDVTKRSSIEAFHDGVC